MLFHLFCLSNTSLFSLVSLGAKVCHTVHLLPYQPYLQIFIAMSHWSGLRPLVSGTPSLLNPYQNSSQMSHNSLDHIDRMGIVPQSQSLHKLQQVLGGVDIIVGLGSG